MTTGTERTVLLTAASVEVTAAAEGKPLPRVSIVAYTGGLMKVSGWGLIAIDLAGLDLGGPQVAILCDHDASIDGILGQGQAEVRDHTLLVQGTVSAATEAARQVVDLARSGFRFQASVGLEPGDTVRVSAGQAVQVNGRSLAAPEGGFTLIQSGRLREVSVVALGCDAETSVRIAAQKGTKQMAVELDEKAIRTEERERLSRIEAACGDLRKWDGQAEEVTKLKSQAIAGDLSVEQLQGKLLELLRSSRPQAPALLASRPQVCNAKVLAAALLCRLGLEGLGERRLGAVAMEEGRPLGGSHLLDLCKAALACDGLDAPSGRVELVKAALSSYSLPTALGDVANRLLVEAYEESPATWAAFGAVRSVPDFKPNSGVRPTFVDGLELVPPGGEIKHGSVKESVFEYRIDTYGRMLTIDRRDIINDNLSVFEQTARAFGQAARRKVSDLVFETLLSNQGGFFSAAHGNLLTGAGAALGIDGLEQGVALMRTQRDEEGNDLDLKPKVLVVPPELDATARQLLASEYVQRESKGPTGNPLRDIVGLEVEPRLSNAVKYKNKASAKQWFVFAPPSASAVVVAFLNGQQTPNIEFFGVESTPNQLSASWRVYFDFGTALADYRAAVRSNGQ